MSSRSRRLLIVGVFVVAAVVLAAWLGGPRMSGGTLGRIRREGVIRIGYANEAPYAYLDARGALTGAEVEVAKKVVEALGVERIEWSQTEFGSLITELESGRFDAVVAGMFITPERARVVSFSEPTFRVRQALLVREGNPLGLHTYADVAARPKLNVAVLQGSIEESTLRRLGVPESRLLVVPDALTGRVAVESGLAGALALSSPTIRFMAQQRMLGLTQVPEPFDPPADPRRLEGYGAVAFRKGDSLLREAWNRELNRFIGSPEHRGLLERFGFSANELPGTITTEEILAVGAR